MGRVTGLGGVFFKAQDPERLYAPRAGLENLREDALGDGQAPR